MSAGKENKQLAVSVAILELINSDGLSGITHSKISRRSGVSRAWMYEYIGKEKQALIEFAANVFGAYITKANEVTLPQSRAELFERLEEDTQFLFDAIGSNPAVINLYFRFRGTENPVGQVIAKYEKHWLKDAVEMFKSALKCSAKEAEMLAEVLLTLRLGLTHRLATAKKPAEARARLSEVFAQIQSRF